MYRPLIAATAFLAASAIAAAADDAQPSFDCAKAGAPIEHAICADVSLAKLDADLAARYTEALGTGDAEALRAEQRAWAEERANACAILPGADDDVPDFTSAQIDCLKSLYTDRIAAIGAAPIRSAGDPARAIDGMWQLADVIEATDKSLTGTGQQGRIIRLDRHGLATLDGAGCSGPTLEALDQVRARPLDADETALLAKADAAGSNGTGGIAGFCLGRLFALYVPTADGSLIVADAGAVYRLRRLAPNP